MGIVKRQMPEGGCVALIVAVVSLAIAIAAFVLTLWFCWDNINKTPVTRGAVASDKVKAKMKYHGVQVVECKGDSDVCWFYRNGKKVKI